jgi:hypothetical protein
LDVSNLQIIRKLFENEYLCLNVYFSTRADDNEKGLCISNIDKSSFDEMMELSNISNETLKKCFTNGDDFGNNTYLIFYFSISDFKSESVESTDLYEMKTTPLALISEITDTIGEMVECGIAINDIKCHHFASEW